MNEIELKEIYTGIKNGDKQAFKFFFDIFFIRLLFYACRFVDKETGEDIVQDVFMYIWEKKEDIVMEDSFISFLYEMVYNKSINILNHNKVKEKNIAQIRMLQKAQEYFSPYDNPVFDQLINNDNYENIKTAIDNLPERGKQCIQMSYMQGLTAKEISEILKISPRTVETHIYNSIKSLREIFNKIQEKNEKSLLDINRRVSNNKNADFKLDTLLIYLLFFIV